MCYLTKEKILHNFCPWLYSSISSIKFQGLSYVFMLKYSFYSIGKFETQQYHISHAYVAQQLIPEDMFVIPYMRRSQKQKLAFSYTPHESFSTIGHIQEDFCKRGLDFYISLSLPSLGCPKMTQHWKCSSIQADSGAKILVILEIGHEIEID